MDFAVRKHKHHSKDSYSASSIDVAYSFAKEIHKELKDLIKAIVLFGSAARKKQDASDIDILIVVDDVSIVMEKQVVQAYRLLVEKTIAKTSTKIHVTSMKFTSFWEYVRAGDPVAINILRDGYALLDTGFFDPLQRLLHQGKIRPSPEAQWTYYYRAPRSLSNSKERLLQAGIDLYWAVIDAAHAALMSINEVPPSPEHVADLMEAKLVKAKLADKKYPWTMRKFYDLSKEIARGTKSELTGQEYDALYKEAKEFVDAMGKIIKQ